VIICKEWSTEKNCDGVIIWLDKYLGGIKFINAYSRGCFFIWQVDGFMYNDLKTLSEELDDENQIYLTRLTNNGEDEVILS